MQFSRQKGFHHWSQVAVWVIPIFSIGMKKEIYRHAYNTRVASLITWCITSSLVMDFHLGELAHCLWKYSVSLVEVVFYCVIAHQRHLTALHSTKIVDFPVRSHKVPVVYWTPLPLFFLFKSKSRDDNLINKKIPSLDYNYWLKVWTLNFNEPTNQNSLKVLKVVKTTNKKLLKQLIMQLCNLKKDVPCS